MSFIGPVLGSRMLHQSTSRIFDQIWKHTKN